MNILHIASIDESPYSGVSVVVPKHIMAQREFENVAFLNIQNKSFNWNETIKYSKCPKIDELPEPFNKPDIVIFHQVFYPMYIKYAKQIRGKIPYIVVPHGCLNKEALKKKWLKKVIANKLIFNRFVSKAVAIQCLSDKEKNSILFSNSKIIGTNGITLPDKRKTSFSENGIKMLFIGRLDMYHKGIDILLESIYNNFELLKSKNVMVEIYGPDIDNSKNDINRMIEKYGINNIVSLKDGIKDKQKEEKLLEADVFVQTSRFEGMPMGILEALSYGIPCLVTEGTTLGDLIRGYDAGWVADTSVFGLSKTMIELIEEKGCLVHKSDNAYELIKNEFDWKNVSKNVIQEYKKFI